MTFQCTGCSVKSYDKHWKLERHRRESIPCFKHFFPGEPLPIRFKCSECDKFGPEGSGRKADVKRHLRLIHRMDPEEDASSVISTRPTRPTNTFSQASTQVDTAAAQGFQQTASSFAHQDQTLQTAMTIVTPNNSVVDDPRSRVNTLQQSEPLQNDGAAVVPIGLILSGIGRSIDLRRVMESDARRLPPSEHCIGNVEYSGTLRCRIADIIN